MCAVYPTTSISEEVAPLPKRIVICCDGTWQSATSLDPTKGSASNVTRLSRVVAKAGKDKDSKVWQQVVYYDAGIGTGDITDFERTRQGGLGIGLAENVIEAYNFIANNYSPGDELFFFGFSRGAYTVRATAGIVGEIGVAKPAALPAFIKCYSEYITVGDRPASFSDLQSWQDYVTAHKDYAIESSANVVIQVVGVWDTVGSLGVPDLGHFWKLYKADPKAHEFYDTDLNPGIKHAYQALALDERRSAFSPSLWTLPPNSTTKLVQCWFPGAHINVGGGKALPPNTTDLHAEQLASISYAWMLDRIRPHLAFDTTALDSQFLPFDVLADTLTPKSTSPQGPSTGQWLWHSARNGVRAAKRASWNIVSPTSTGYAKGKIDDSHSLLYWIIGLPVDRTPGRYHDLKGGVTNERIHPSVHYRQLSNKRHGSIIYEPAALRGWERVYEEHGTDEKGRPRQGWMWKKFKEGGRASSSSYTSSVDSKDELKIVTSVSVNGANTNETKHEHREVETQIWEFEIGHMPEELSLERRLIENSWVESVHEEVMRGWERGAAHEEVCCA